MRTESRNNSEKSTQEFKYRTQSMFAIALLLLWLLVYLGIHYQIIRNH